MSLPNHKPLREEDATDGQIRRRVLKAMLGFGAASLVPVGVWQWVKRQPNAGGVPEVLRNALNINEKVAGTYFSATNLAPTYPADRAANPPRTNGRSGLQSPLNLDTYRITIEQPNRKPFAISVDELKTLPKHELVFNFKCVEGWSQIQHWGGVLFTDFVARYGLATRSGRAPSTDDLADLFRYVGMETPDGGYYVGLDMPSALHPQTLLAYEMNGRPITPDHGAPLRLMTTVKYGVKSLKRIGSIRFTDDRPRDFWAERGYDYHLGL